MALLDQKIETWNPYTHIWVPPRFEGLIKGSFVSSLPVQAHPRDHPENRVIVLTTDGFYSCTFFFAYCLTTFYSSSDTDK